jgi:hypothetical protein
MIRSSSQRSHSLLGSLILLLATLGSKAKPCGILPIFDQEANLNEKTFIRSDENFVSSENGKAFATFGWIQLSDVSARRHDILSISFAQSANALLAAPSFANFARLSYDASDPGAPKLILRHAFNSTDVKEDSFAFKLPANTWIAFTYTFDLAQDVAMIYLTGDGVNFTGQISLNLKEFNIPQRLEFVIGCFPRSSMTQAEAQVMEQTCVKGKTRGLGMTLEFLKDPRFAHLLLVNSKASFASFRLANDKGLPSEETSIRESGGSKSTVKLLKSESASFYELSDSVIGSPAQSDFLQSFSLYFELTFLENLKENFLIFTQEVKSNNQQVNHMEIRLVGTGINRKLEVSYPGQKGETFSAEDQVMAISQNNIAVSFVLKENNYFSILFKINGSFSSFESSGSRGLFQLTGPLRVLKDEDNHLIVKQFSVMQGALATALSQTRQSPSWITSTCQNKCQIPFTEMFGIRRCIVCDKGLVSAVGRCTQVCPKGYLGNEGFCLKCKTEQCAEITLSKFFRVTKQSEDRFLIRPSPDLVNLNGNYASMIKVSLSTGIKGTDYDYKVETKDNGSSAVYTFDFRNTLKLDPSLLVNFEANPLLVVYDKSGTYVQGEKIGIPFGSEHVDPDFVSSASDSGFSDEVIDAKSEKASEILGIIAFAIFAFGILIALLGIFTRKVLALPPAFLFQKLIQSYLIFYFITFWLLYNSQLPRNILSFLRSLYKLSVGWHSVFNVPAQQMLGLGSNLPLSGYWRFAKEEVLSSFVLNFGVIFAIQGAILFTWGALRLALLIRNIVKGSSVKGEYRSTDGSPIELDEDTSLLERIIGFFEWKVVITVFAIFVTETSIFEVNNFVHVDLSKPFFTFSFAWSIIYFFIGVVSIALVLVVSLLPNWILNSHKTFRTFNFVFRGLSIENRPQRAFQGIQYVFFFANSVILAASFNQRLGQIIPALVLTAGMAAYVVIFRPAAEITDKVEQIVTYGLLLLSMTFFSAIVIDDTSRIMNGFQRWALGFVAIVLAVLIILWNTLIICIRVGQYWYRCIKLRREAAMGFVVIADQMNGVQMKGETGEDIHVGVNSLSHVTGMVSSKVEMLASFAQRPSTSKKTIRLDQYIENDEGHRITPTLNNDALSFANSNVYMNTRPFPQNGTINQENNKTHLRHVQRHSAPVNLVHSAPFTDFKALNGSNRMNDNRQAQLESQIINQQFNGPQILESQLQSTKPIKFSQLNMQASQKPELPYSMLNSYTSDRFANPEATSVIEPGPGLAFNKKKDSVLHSHLISNKDNVIMEESHFDETIIENSQLHDAAMKYFDRESGEGKNNKQ